MTQTQQIPSPSSAPPARPAEIIAWAKGLGKTFGDRKIVQDLNFEIPRGTIFGFIGPSGCGKTTTVRLLTGIYKPSDGEVNVMGKSPANFSKRDRERLGYLTQGFVLYPELSVWENMNFAASLYGYSIRRTKRLNELLDFVELGDHKNKLARDLSGGMQRRLSLAATLIHQPDVLFLDEPTAGIDPILRRKIWDVFEELRSQGYTLFVTTQYVGEAAYCDLVGVMSEGRLLFVDTPEGLRHRAFGGDVVHLRTVETFPYQHLRALENMPFVKAPLIQVDNHEIRLVVDEANTAIPPVVEWARQNNLELESVGEYLPPYDDVFVKLVRDDSGESTNA